MKNKKAKNANADKRVTIINRAITGPDISIKQKIRAEVLCLLRKSYAPNILSALNLLAILHNLQDQNVYRNKRSIYYDSVTVFKSQFVVDRLITHYTRKFNCTMADLHLKASLKGVFHGELVFRYKNGSIQKCVGKNIIPDMEEVSHVRNSCKVVLVVEKDSVLSSLVDSSLIIVCGKGFPCYNTTRLLELFSVETEIHCLTDFDPYGIDIFLTYKARVGRIRRSGIRAQDIFEYRIRSIETIPLTTNDCCRINSIRNRISWIEEKPEIEYDLEFMEAVGFKIELEAIVGCETFNIIKYLALK